mgnify:FL=1
MSYCDNCGNFDYSAIEDLEDSEIQKEKFSIDYQPDLYYYWDNPMEENYDWRDTLPEADCLCEICFDILNSEKKIKWKCAST